MTLRNPVVTDPKDAMTLITIWRMMTQFNSLNANAHIKDIVIPSEALCDTPGWQPEQITDEKHDGNCDDEGDRDVENTLLGPTYVYSSASEPNQESGAFRNPSEFLCALLDPKQEGDPEMMIYGGDYTSSKDLRLDLIFPVIFPFGTGDHKMHPS
ncbi:hypothetical protein THAOC_26034, partial [Thalassiosira oceanica]